MSRDGSLPKQYLFLDFRHIRCGDLQWLTPEGQPLPLKNPPEPPVEARPRPRFLPHGIRLEAQRAAQEGPIDGLATTVIADGGVYRSWDVALGGAPGAVEVRIACRESKDGYQWRDAATSVLPMGGWTDGLEGWGFFKDPHGAPEERYKAVYSPRPPRDQWPRLWESYRRLDARYRDPRLGPEVKMRCICGAVSSDGLHWTLLPEPLMIHMGDTDNSVHYDEALGRYVLYTRRYISDRRSVGRAEAEEFRRWGPILPCVEPDLEDPAEDLYTNGRTEYPGLPQYQLMFPMFYHRWDQTSDIRLLTSADGIAWQRVPGGSGSATAPLSLIVPGPAGRWDSEFLASAKNLVRLGQDRVAVPYIGTAYPHKYPRWPEVQRANRRCGWASWPTGRLCGVVADREGEFWTLGLPVAGRQLRLNVQARRGGEVRVELIRLGARVDSTTDAGRVPLHPAEAPKQASLEAEPIRGDQFAAPVRWRGAAEIPAPEGELVTLHFQLRSAKLFGFEWV